MNEIYWTNLNKIETLVKGSRMTRFLNNPIRYFSLMVFKRFIYKLTRKGRIVKCKTFFNTEMKVNLPSGFDICLTGSKTHDSEIRMTKFLLNNIQAGDCFIDVGAHFGFYSLLASCLVTPRGKVYAFEPSPKSYKILKLNTHQIKNIEIHNLAISHSNKQMTFYEFPLHLSEYNTLELNQHINENWYKGQKPIPLNVKSMSLDEFLTIEMISPKFLKIDVEGFELEVINGCINYLEINSPILIIEHLSSIQGNEKHLETNRILESLGYNTYVITKEGKLKLEEDISLYLSEIKLETDNIVYKKVPADNRR